MPGTPIAKSHSLFSANSFTWRGVMSCSASAFRSSGRSGGMLERLELAVDAQRRRPPDLQVEVGARCAGSCCCSTALKLNAGRRSAGARRCRPAPGCVGLAIGIDPEERPGRTRPAAHPATRTSRTTPENSDSISFMIFIASMMQTICPFAMRVAHRDVRLGARLGRRVERADHRRLDLEPLDFGGSAPAATSPRRDRRAIRPA